jgi:branched-chain amino acid transport system substrate-binding protein
VFDKTGNFAANSVDAQAAVDIWVDKINSEGGVNGRPVKVEVKDSASDPARAGEVFRELAKDGVPAVLGPLPGALCGIAKPIAEETGTVMYCFSGGSFPYTPHFYLGHLPAAFNLGTLPIEFLKQKFNVKKIGCLATSDQSGDAFSNAFKAEADRLGVEVVNERFQAGDVDVSAQIEKMRAANIDALYICTSGANILTGLRGVQQIGLTVPVWTPSGSVSLSKDMAGVMPAGGLYTGVQYVGFPEATPDYLDKAEVQYFHDKFLEKTGKVPDVVGAIAVDGLKMYLDAIANGAKTGTEIAAHMETLKDFPGILSTYTMSPTDHRGTRPVPLVGQLQPDGTFKLVGQVDINS